MHFVLDSQIECGIDRSLWETREIQQGLFKLSG